MKIIIDSTKKSLVTKIHLNIDSISIEISDFESISSVSILEKEGEIFIDSITTQDITSSDVEVFEKNIPILDVEPESVLVADVEDPLLKSNDILEKASSLDNEDFSTNSLFQKLVNLRKELSARSQVPPYIIFHDKSLKKMVSDLPIDLNSMKNISGVGEAKLEKYGQEFINVIKEYLENT